MAALDTVLHAMLDRSRGKLIMAAAVASAVSGYLHAKKRVIIEDGGPQITNPLLVGRNPNVTSTQYYDTVPVDQTDEFITAEFNMSRVVGTVIISDQEEDENKGRAAIFKILKGKIMALDQSISEKFAEYHTSLGTGNDPNGLANLIPTDPTSGTVGGISLATESQWRTSSYDFAGTLTPENIEEAFDDIIELDLNNTAGDTEGSRKPNVIFAGRNIYRMHKAAARDKMQISLNETGTGKKLVNMGITGTTHGGIPVLYDEMLDPNLAYFVNDAYLSLHVLAGVNMKVKQLVAPWNMDVTGRRVVWEGQLCRWKGYRTHAVLDNNA